MLREMRHDEELVRTLESLAFNLANRPGRSTLALALRSLSAQESKPLDSTFARIVRALDGVEFAVIGGLGVRAYVQQRTTDDIDVILRGDDYSEASRRILDLGFETDGLVDLGGDQFIKYASPSGVDLDVMLALKAYQQEAISNAARMEFPGGGVRVVSPEYLILFKLDAMRGFDSDESDVRALIRAGVVDVNRVEALVEEHLPYLLDDFRSLRDLAEAGL